MMGDSEKLVSSVEVEFSTAAFSLETIKKAAYRLVAHFSADIRPENTLIKCRLEFRAPVSRADAEEAVRAFRDEVLDQDLRVIIAEETAPIRNATLAYAFSQTKLQSE